MMNFRHAIALIGGLVSSAALADPGDVTFSSKVSYVFSDGELSGCAASFDVLHPDSEYQHGNFVHVAGSLNYSVIKDAPYFTLKLGVPTRS